MERLPRSKAIFMVAALSQVIGIASCGSDSTGGAEQEEPLIALRAAYNLEMRYLGGRCDGVSDELTAVVARAAVEQTGNKIDWRQQRLSAEGLISGDHWQLQGQLCPATPAAEGFDSAGENEIGVELLLKGGRVYRLAMGSDFCRAEVRIPARNGCTSTVAQCGENDAIRLNVDSCSGRLFGSFWADVNYGEACADRAGECTMLFEMVGTPLDVTEPECQPLPAPSLPVLCDQSAAVN